MNPDCISISGLTDSHKMFLTNPPTPLMNNITLYSQPLSKHLSKCVHGPTRGCRWIQTAALPKTQSSPDLSMVLCVSALSITLYFLRRMQAKSCNDDTGPFLHLTLILLAHLTAQLDLSAICPVWRPTKLQIL
jgi:hypothetical protein